MRRLCHPISDCQGLDCIQFIMHAISDECGAASSPAYESSIVHGHVLSKTVCFELGLHGAALICWPPLILPRCTLATEAQMSKQARIGTPQQEPPWRLENSPAHPQSVCERYNEGELSRTSSSSMPRRVSLSRRCSHESHDQSIIL